MPIDFPDEILNIIFSYIGPTKEGIIMNKIISFYNESKEDLHFPIYILDLIRKVNKAIKKTNDELLILNIHPRKNKLQIQHKKEFIKHIKFVMVDF